MTELLTALAIVFIVAGPFLLLANRFDLPVVPALVIAGILGGFGIEEEMTLELAQWGITLLVFFFGVQIQFDAIRVVLADSERVAIAQVLIVGVLGLMVGVVIGLSITEAAFVAIAAAFSSTIVSTSLLQSDIRKNLVRGRLAESINLVQDLLAIFVILVLGAETFAGDAVAMQIGYGVLLLLAAAVINRYLFGLLTRFSEGSDEQLIVSIIALLVGFIAAAEVIGVSIVVGGFTAGLAVKYDPDAYYSVFDGLESIRDFFVAIFFVTVGALVTVPNATVFVLAMALGFLTAVVKPLITALLLVYSGYERRSSTLVSLNLDQISEFTLIIVIEAMVLGLILQDVFDAIIIAAAATMITSSLSQAYDEAVYRTLADWRLLSGQHSKIDERSHVPDDLTDHVVIVGFGRMGRQIVNTCKRLEVPYVVVENDPIRLQALQDECDAFIFGDANERYTWQLASLDEAKLVVSTVNSTPVSEFLVGFADEIDMMLRTDDIEYAVTLHNRSSTTNRFLVCVDDVLAAERLIEFFESIGDDSKTNEQFRTEHLTSLNDELSQ